MNREKAPKPQPDMILFTGPENVRNAKGEQVPAWFVAVTDCGREPVGRVYKVYDFDKAHILALKMADQRGLHFELEALPDGWIGPPPWGLEDPEEGTRRIYEYYARKKEREVRHDLWGNPQKRQMNPAIVRRRAMG